MNLSKLPQNSQKDIPAKIGLSRLNPIIFFGMRRAGTGQDWLNHKKSEKNVFFDCPYRLWLTARGTRRLQLATRPKLTGWLESLDLRKPHASRILSHRITSQDPPRLIPHLISLFFFWRSIRVEKRRDLHQIGHAEVSSWRLHKKFRIFFETFWKNLPNIAILPRQIAFSKNHLVPILSDFWQPKFLCYDWLGIKLIVIIEALKQLNLVKNMSIAFPDSKYFSSIFDHKSPICPWQKILRLTIHKLTGWLASLDLRKPHTSRIISHRITSQDPPRLIPLSTNTQGRLVPQVATLKGVRVKERGRGKPMNDLVVRKSDLPPTKQN